MATVTNRLAFLISANADQAIKAFDKTANAADKQLGKAANKVDKLGASLTKFGAAGLAAAGTLGAGLYSMAQGAIEDQRAQALLAQQLRNSTGATKEQIAAVEASIDSMARASGIADDQLRPAYSNLVRATGSMTRAQKLLALSMDISRATGRDLATVTIGIGRAANGQFGALTRLGIPLDEATKKSKDFNKVLEVLTKQFGGQASAYAETYAGKIERAKVAIDEAKESLGAGFAPVIENVSGLLNKGATAFTSMDRASAGVVGQIASFGVVGLGLASTLSLVAGQAIKMRTAFRDADGQINTLGKTAKIASVALATMAIAQTVGDAILELGGASRETAQRVNELTIALGKGDTKSVATEFAELADQLKNTDTSFMGLGALAKQFGKAIRVAGADTDAGRIAIEYLDEAFTQTANKSPENAQKIINALYEQSLALDKNSDTYKDNLMLVGRYQKQLNAITGALQVTGQAQEDEAEKTAKAAEAKRQAEERTRKLADAQDKFKQKVVSSADALRSKLNTALEAAKDNLKKANEEFNAYQKSISSAITGTISFSSAQQTAAKNVEDLKTATADVATAQKDYADAVKEGDPDKTAEALKRLTDAQTKLSEAQKTPQTFLASLKNQETAATTFAGNIQRLLDLGAKQGLIDQLAASGAEAGNAIASEILGSADPKGYVDQVNTIIASTQSIADQVGKNSAAKFKQAGVDSATQLLTGMNDVLSKAQISLKFSNLNKKGKPVKTLKDLTNLLQDSITGLFTVGGFATADVPQLAEGGIVKASPGGTLALLGEGGRNEAVVPLPDNGRLGGQNVYITVQTGVGDPVAIGAALVDVLQKYQSRTGSLPLKVR